MGITGRDPNSPPARQPQGRLRAWTPQSARERFEGALRALGALGLVGVVTTRFLLTAGVATRPSHYVPARSGGWPGWMAGPAAGTGRGHLKTTASRRSC